MLNFEGILTIILGGQIFLRVILIGENSGAFMALKKLKKKTFKKQKNLLKNLD